MTATHHEAAPVPPPGPVAAGPGPQAEPHIGQDGAETVTVKVWQVPVRLFHWLLVTSIVVLSVTGFYIGTPFLAPGIGPDLLMQYVHTIHVGAGFVFIGLLVFRVYFAFVGNRYARWDQFVLVHKKERQGIIPVLRHYFFAAKEAPVFVGHNPLAGMTYAALLVMFLAQAFTGLALESLEARGGLLWSLSGWVFDLAPVGMVRLIHHIIMWITWGFVIQHLYSAILTDNSERSGLISSMFSGRKHLPRNLVPSDLLPAQPVKQPVKQAQPVPGMRPKGEDGS